MKEEHPEFEGFPKPARVHPRAFKTPKERFVHFAHVQAEEGGLLPVSIVPRLLGVSRSRVSQMRQAGLLRTVDIFGDKFVSIPEIIEFAGRERPTGRPKIEAA